MLELKEASRIFRAWSRGSAPALALLHPPVPWGLGLRVEGLRGFRV